MARPISPRWKRRLLRALVWTAVLVILLRWFEHDQVYHPDRSWVAAPADVVQAGESVSFTTPDGLQLSGWFLPAPANTDRPFTAILQSHGNAGNVSHRIEYYRLFRSLGCAVLAYDYRGYGRSEGHPSEEGTYVDAVTAFDWLRARGFTHIIAFGESLGGAIAVELALRRPVTALALSSSFTCIPDLGSELFPFLPVRTLSRIRYDTHSKLAQVRVPVLILHSRADSLIGFHHAERNYASAREPKMLREIEGDHNDQPAVNPDRFRAALLELMNIPAVCGTP